MSQIKPTIVFVPGAWHTSAGYSAVGKLLKAAGYTTKLVDLKSVSGKPITGSGFGTLFTPIDNTE